MSAFVFPLDEQDPVGFALAYPFARPAGSFVFEAASERVAPAGPVLIFHQARAVVDGVEVPIVSAAAEVEGRSREFVGRIPVLASGSNAAPSQLARKYRGHPDFPPILVHEVEVEGLVSVYSAHVARYGSVAATLVPCPSFTARLHLLLVPSGAFAHLNRTESLGANYLLAELSALPLAAGRECITPLAYISRRGPARFGGRPRRLPGTGTGAGAFETASQEDILRMLQGLLGDESELRPFVRRLIEDESFRAEATRRLAQTTRRVLLGGAKVLAGG